MELWNAGEAQRAAAMVMGPVGGGQLGFFVLLHRMHQRNKVLRLISCTNPMVSSPVCISQPPGPGSLCSLSDAAVGTVSDALIPGNIMKRGGEVNRTDLPQFSLYTEVGITF